MNKFENQLAESAHRVRERENAGLKVPGNPLRSEHRRWGWIATPAAAVAGIALGWSVSGAIGKEEEKVRLVQVHDTVVAPKVVHDTVSVREIVERERVVWREAEETPLAQVAVEDIGQDECTSMACDGIDYSMLCGGN
ncbi:MAG: hypothetical protein HUK04_04550 [Bacteroidaceae bacterium]|nr:hypothetical protein [Bacteroidaceae bacterium]